MGLFIYYETIAIFMPPASAHESTRIVEKYFKFPIDKFRRFGIKRLGISEKGSEREK